MSSVGEEMHVDPVVVEFVAPTLQKADDGHGRLLSTSLRTLFKMSEEEQDYKKHYITQKQQSIRSERQRQKEEHGKMWLLVRTGRFLQVLPRSIVLGAEHLVSPLVKLFKMQQLAKWLATSIQFTREEIESLWNGLPSGFVGLYNYQIETSGGKAYY